MRNLIRRALSKNKAVHFRNEMDVKIVKLNAAFYEK